MRPRVTVTIKRDDWDKSLEVIGGSWSDLDPGDVYELVPACPDCDEGLLHEGCRYYAIGNSVCTKCGEYVPCPSCSVGPKQTEQNKGQHDDYEYAPMGEPGYPVEERNMRGQHDDHPEAP